MPTFGGFTKPKKHAETHAAGGSDPIVGGGGGGATDLNYVPATRTLESSTGADAVLPEVVAAGDSGLMTGADKTKLDGVAAGAQVNVATDLSYTAATRLLASSTGADVTLPEVVAAGNSGLMTGADKTKVNNLNTAAYVAVGTFAPAAHGHNITDIAPAGGGEGQVATIVAGIPSWATPAVSSSVLVVNSPLSLPVVGLADVGRVALVTDRGDIVVVTTMPGPSYAWLPVGQFDPKTMSGPTTSPLTPDLTLALYYVIVLDAGGFSILTPAAVPTGVVPVTLMFINLEALTAVDVSLTDFWIAGGLPLGTITIPANETRVYKFQTVIRASDGVPLSAEQISPPPVGAPGGNGLVIAESAAELAAPTEAGMAAFATNTGTLLQSVVDGLGFAWERAGSMEPAVLPDGWVAPVSPYLPNLNLVTTGTLLHVLDVAGAAFHVFPPSAVSADCANQLLTLIVHNTGLVDGTLTLWPSEGVEIPWSWLAPATATAFGTLTIPAGWSMVLKFRVTTDGLTWSALQVEPSFVVSISGGGGGNTLSAMFGYVTEPPTTVQPVQGVEFRIPGLEIAGVTTPLMATVNAVAATITPTGSPLAVAVISTDLAVFNTPAFALCGDDTDPILFSDAAYGHPISHLATVATNSADWRFRDDQVDPPLRVAFQGGQTVAVETPSGAVMATGVLAIPSGFTNDGTLNPIAQTAALAISRVVGDSGLTTALDGIVTPVGVANWLVGWNAEFQDSSAPIAKRIRMFPYGTSGAVGAATSFGTNLLSPKEHAGMVGLLLDSPGGETLHLNTQLFGGASGGLLLNSMSMWMAPVLGAYASIGQYAVDQSGGEGQTVSATWEGFPTLAQTYPTISSAEDFTSTGTTISAVRAMRLLVGGAYTFQFGGGVAWIQIQVAGVTVPGTDRGSYYSSMTGQEGHTISTFAVVDVVAGQQITIAWQNSLGPALIPVFDSTLWVMEIPTGGGSRPVPPDPPEPPPEIPDWLAAQTYAMAIIDTVAYAGAVAAPASAIIDTVADAGAVAAPASAIIDTVAFAGAVAAPASAIIATVAFAGDPVVLIRNQ